MKWWAITCGTVGGGIPFLFGVYLAGHEMVYRALHPTPPGMGACGTSMAVALFAIVVGTPLGAGVFAAVGSVIGGCVAPCQRRPVEPSGELIPPGALEHRMDDNPYRSPASPTDRTGHVAGLSRIVMVAGRVSVNVVFCALVLAMVAGVLVLLFLVS